MSNRINKEKEFHDQRSGSSNVRLAINKYYSISKIHRSYYQGLISSFCKNKKLLEIGCGTGKNSILWTKYGADVVGIDISSQRISNAKEMARERRLRAEFFEMNVEEMDFKDDSFDIVVGSSILHHLDIEKACHEVSRVLKQGGHAIFSEPLGHNLIVNLYRKFTPNMRTEDEHPLLMSELKKIREQFGKVDIRFFHIFTLLAIPLRRFRFFNHLLNVLHLIDRSLMYILPFIRRFSWLIVLDCQNLKQLKS
jgi:ubiquinone/menaquinone biosynthesis C-methylase UbiE